MNIKQIITFILMILLCTTLIIAQNDIKTYVNDYANIISPQVEAQITQILQPIHTAGVAEIAIVTVKSLEGKEINNYAYDLAEGKLGDITKNNGLLLLIAVEDRKYRFEVGRGLEGELNDAKVGRIGRQFLVPSFKENNYESGILQTTQALQTILVEGADPFPATTRTYSSERFKLYFYIFLMIIMILSSIFGKRRHTRNNNYFTAAIIAASMFSGRGRGGLGGGGFGGGSFGGGGAGGSW